MALSGSFSKSIVSGAYTLRVDWSGNQSIANNTTTPTLDIYLVQKSTWDINVSSRASTAVIDGTTYNFTAPAVKNSGGTTTKIGTVTGNAIKHNDDGTKTITVTVTYPIKATLNGTYYSKITATATITFDNIARISTLTASNGTLGTPQTLSINSYSDDFTHSIRYDCGTASAAVCTKVSDTSILFTPSLNLAKQNTTGQSVSVTFTLYTFSGDTEIGTTTKTITCAIPESVKPSCSISVYDAKGFANSFGAYIQGLSTLQIDVAPTMAQGSPIASYRTVADGSTYTAQSFTTGVLKSSGSLDIVATVTDKRGRSGSDTETISVLEYKKPTITKLTAARCDADGTENKQGLYCKVTFSAKVYDLSGKNSANYILSYNDTGETLYDFANVFEPTNATYIFAADENTAYNITLSVVDGFDMGTRSTSVQSAFLLAHFDVNNDAVSFGMKSTKANSLQSALPMYDKYDTLIGNGLAAYTGGGDNGIDPNTTLEGLILTSHTNAPQGLGVFFYIHTLFYNTKSSTASRAQIAIKYNSNSLIYHRYYYNGAWSNWTKPLYDGDEKAQLGYIELSDTTPFIDFHANSSTSDFTHRIIAGSPANALDIIDAGGGGIRLRSGGSIQLAGQSQNGAKFVAVLSDRLRTSSNDEKYLGDSTYKWKAVYATNGTIQTSDRNQKKNIADIGQKYVDLFDKLQPVTFEFNRENSDRVHVGFISQDVKAAMDELGISDVEFAAYCRDIKTKYDEETGNDVEIYDDNGNPVYLYSLRYQEFIALNTKMIQMNRQRIADQQAEIDSLKEELAELKQIVSNLVDRG